MSPENPAPAPLDAYWSRELRGFSAPTPLLVDRPAERVTADGSRAVVKRTVSERTRAALAVVVAEPALSLETLAAGLWALLLGRYSGEERVLFGRSIEGRVLPCGVDLDSAESGAVFLARLEDEHEARRAAANVSDELLAELCEVPCGTPLFESALAPAAGADLALVFGLSAEGELRLDYDAGRFDADVIERMAGHLSVLLDGLVGSSATALGRLPILTGEEHQQIVVDWNAVEHEFPRDRCLHELFEDHVDRDPAAPAVAFGEARLTYGELEQRANRLAQHLRTLGVGPDVPVGICLERGLEMVVGLVAITKAGGGYVPLDPTYPTERLEFLVSDSAVPVLLTQSSLEGLFTGSDARLVRIDADADVIAGCSADRPDSGVAPEHLAYLIYTSGSTGTPKGVVLDHRGRVNNFNDFNVRFSVGPGDRLLGLASMSFDMCAYDVFGTLMAGAEIVVGDTAGLEPGQWARLMVEREITVWHSVPALLEMMVEHVTDRPDLHPRALRLVLLGGDWIPVSLPDRLKALTPGVTVISMGGATECSMDSTIYEIAQTDEAWKSIPYGGPMWNQRCYVLDRDGQPVPVGVPGELYLGGVGVARCYHNREELTAERFLDNPFVPGERMYRTGDLVRWREDGNLVLLGRMDFQVKVRGFRIELGEIEAALRQHGDVRECVLAARGEAGQEKRIVAYVIREPDAGADVLEDGAVDEQVDRWSAVYDSAYSRGDATEDPTFNIRSWDSSYTGEAIPAEEMHEWVDSIVDRIGELAPKRVLEIGCGTGLLLFRIAPSCEKYWGTDISQVALDHVSAHLAERGLDQVTLDKRGGDEFDDLPDDSFDCVILNSIVMDFPSPEYIEQVLRIAARLVAPGGFIFVGDVRNLRTAELFQASVQLHRAPSNWTGAQLAAGLPKRLEMEEELVIDPAFFVSLKDRIEEVSHVEIALKRGGFQNEMVKFRYNATLFIGDPGAVPAFDGPRLDWTAEGLDLEKLEARLAAEPADTLLVQDIPNLRTWADQRLLEVIAEPAAAETSAADLRGRRTELERATPTVDPQAILKRLDTAGYQAHVRFAASGDEACFDAMFVRRPKGAPVRFPFDQAVDPAADRASFFNDPMSSTRNQSLTPRLRKFLGERLPAYMVPSAFVFIEAFPLSPNGKINRRALPEPDNLRPDLEQEYVEPRDAVERLVCEIWAGGLGLDRVGVHDGFVALGGNSLLATQLVSRLRDVFSVELPLKLCLTLDIAELCAALAAAGGEQGVDVAQVAEVVLELEGLSEAEIESLLDEETATS